ncbi:baseplate J/gp47 family protein [Methylobacterium sp. J-030]|uniref:baseplate J/gp47 family protein n=1 Tax=Methylobacterium sp. J-030 TaxID=2836627 RepID=UPI001FBB18C0|nr:baseplate J/gp47 family protein [Methylobacterium sp. J-030]MCJ2067744.1 baseplate J/gp47 family protein [Methylobacterium sp. J-030]
MPLLIPTRDTVRAQVRDYLAARLAAADGLPPNSRARVIGDGNAELAFSAYQFIQALAVQFLPDTAVGPWLDRWLDIFLDGREAATFASGAATLTGTFGTVVPAATQLTAGGLTFATTQQITIGTGPTAVAIMALAAGSAGNLPAGTSIALVTGIPGVDGSGLVVQLSGGVDVEDDTDARTRVLARIRQPPMGGDADDYVAWAREVPGVTRAWCAPNEMGVGTVTIRFMMDNLRAGNFGFPNATDVATVQAHIDLRRPVTVADCFVCAPIPTGILVPITGLCPDTASNRAAVATALQAMLAQRAAPARSVNGALVPAQTIYAAWVYDAILGAGTVQHFDTSFVDAVMPNNGCMAVMQPGNGGVSFG